MKLQECSTAADFNQWTVDRFESLSNTVRPIHDLHDSIIALMRGLADAMRELAAPDAYDMTRVEKFADYWLTQVEALADATLAGTPYADQYLAAAVVANTPSLKRAEQLHLENAFPDGIGRIPSNPVVAAYVGATSKGGKLARCRKNGWQPNAVGSPIYCHRATSSPDNEQVVVYPDLPRRAEGGPTTTKKEWELIEGLSPRRTLDVMLSVLAQVCAEQRSMHPAGEAVIVNAATILRNKGIRRRGKERTQQERRIDTEMDRLQALKCDVAWSVRLSGDKRKYRLRIWKGDRLFDVVAVEAWQPNLLDETAELVGIEWSVRFGQWRKYWLNAEDKPWLEYCARCLLTLDARHDSDPAIIAKKIGVYLIGLPRASRGESKELLVKTLIERIGEAPSDSDHNWPGRFRERLRRALKILVDINFLDLKWPDYPDCSAECFPEESDRVKGWVERWLTKKLRLTVIASPKPLPALKAGRRQKRKSIPLIAGDDLRRARINEGWHQKDLARYLRISPAHLSLIENGKRHPSKAVEEKIRGLAWFDGQV